MNAPHFVSIAVAICAISVYGQVPPAELGRPQPVPAISPEETPATRPERTAETPQTPRPRGEAKKLLSYKDLAGATVKNNFGQKLGSVENVVIDVHQGRVSLAILSVGEVLRIGGKQVPVPFTALSLTGVENDLMLDAAQGKLETAPGVESDAITDASYKDWAAWSYSYFGVTPYGESRSGAGTAPGADVTPAQMPATTPAASPTPSHEL